MGDKAIEVAVEGQVREVDETEGLRSRLRRRANLYAALFRAVASSIVSEGLGKPINPQLD